MWKSNRLKWELMIKCLNETALAINTRSEKIHFYKRSRLNFLTVCFMLASHPRKVNRLNSQLNSDQRRKCECTAWGFRADPKRGFELVVPRRLSLQWHLILGDRAYKTGLRIKFYLWTESLVCTQEWKGQREEKHVVRVVYLSLRGKIVSFFFLSSVYLLVKNPWKYFPHSCPKQNSSFLNLPSFTVTSR